jgi:arylsulfatase A-like enzyme
VAVRLSGRGSIRGAIAVTIEGTNRLLDEGTAVTRLAPTLLVLLAVAASTVAAAERPNIVLIYADDIGYGDLGCYGATRVATPNLDKLAAGGIRFTDAHSPSATCTPSRYAMLTGEYAWRQRGTGIARGDAAAIIRPGRVTMASLLKQAGYTTGVVGKWHLGLGDGNVDWNGKIAPGPLEIGFDHCYLIPATGDRVPTVYVEDHEVVGLASGDDDLRVRFGQKIGDEPTGRENPELLKMHPSHGHDNTIVNGISRIGFQTGGKPAWWVDEDMADRITERAVAYIGEHAAAADPFFLFFSTHDIHVPRVPHPRFVGQSEMGPRGDAIVQLDWCVGEVLAALEQHGRTDDTLVIFSSDNGPVVDDGYRDDAVRKLGDHRPAGPWRGGKYSNFEGGTRVPFIVRWPARVKPGESAALLGQHDLPMSFAKLVGVADDVPADALPDSFDVLPALLGDSPDGREHLVEHARTLALRKGNWKYIEPGGGPTVNQNTNTELGTDPQGQLYDLANDPGERHNLIAEQPERAQALAAELEALREQGRSRP